MGAEQTTNFNPESHEEMGDMGKSSKAYRELGSQEPASAELINVVDQMKRQAEDARNKAALASLAADKEARLAVQGPINQRGVAQVREALRLKPEERGRTLKARTNLAARSSTADRMKANNKLKPANTANTVEEARERLKDIVDERGK